MRFHSDSLRRPMQANFSEFVGRDYEPPFGCFRLVQHVFESVYGIEFGDYDAGLKAGDLDSRAGRFQKHLCRLTQKVEDPQEGDLILINRGGKPFHIGIVAEPGQMLHAYAGGTSTIEPYTSIFWRNKIEGFYRYVG